MRAIPKKVKWPYIEPNYFTASLPDFLFMTSLP